MTHKRTFAGIPESYAALENAAVVCIPVPYDGTSTWGKGADKGPDAILEAAENMELYDIETNSEPYEVGIYLTQPILTDTSPEEMTEQVYNATRSFLEKGKIVSLIGGEHSVSIGAMQACSEKYPQLTVLQLDAHADLRATYEGSTCNHACAVHEISKKANLVQVGIRSMDKCEVAYMNYDNVFFAEKLKSPEQWIPQVVEKIKGPVYITIDLDAFDPALLPATGTPEPGGLQWYPVLELLKQVCSQKQVVGFDVVELCPNAQSRASNFLAAKLYYKIIAYCFQSGQNVVNNQQSL